MEDYKKLASECRKVVLKMVHLAGTSHIGSNFSCIDVLVVLFSKLNIDKNLKENRDRFILSKGWAAASLYYFLAEKGIIPKEDLEIYCLGDSKYIGLAEPGIRGVEVAGGAMGHGTPMALGMALGAKLAGESWKTYVLMSDGELDCGTTWESAALAAHHKLSNLTLIVDVNGFQAMGKKNEVLNMHPLVDKFRSFNWEVIEIDGHDYKQIEWALETPRKDKPVVIIANTIKGKGVSFFEGKLEWHYKNVNDEDYQKALNELNHG